MKLYTNAQFITCEEDNKIYSAMAVDKGRIQWIGNEEELPEAYRHAEKTDLGGAAVTPAFGDTHMHFASLCVFENTFYLMDVKDFAEAKAIVADYAAKKPKAKILMGYGCSAHTVAEGRLPERKDLDDWTTRPLLIVKYDGHAAVCNSAMMALLSDKVKRDPGCDVETGWLYQNAYYDGVNEATAFISTLDIVRGLGNGADYLASVG
ncbi:MAG: amidohydrolase family protein, partial [Firmicutes bacterium]|nr:amidohydrolase family protein [Bacillota bacterium]